MSRLSALACGLLLACGLSAQAGSTAAPPKGQQKAAAKPTEYDKLVAEADAAAAALKTATAAFQEVQKKAQENRAALAKRFMAAAEKVQGEDRVPYLVWVLANNPSSKELASDALGQIIANHTDSPKLLELMEKVGGLSRLVGPEKPRELFEKVLANNKGDEIRGWASFQLAQQIKSNRGASADDKARVETLLADAEKFAAGTELALRIAGPKFEAERLKIGKDVPEITGVDLTGSPIKLTDYLGKVVVLDFWGFW